jgi:hypothetical protein
VSTEPGTVRAVLSGHAPDLVQLSLFLEAVTRGRNPADVLRDLHLAAITISGMRLPGSRYRQPVTMTFTLKAAPGVATDG